MTGWEKQHEHHLDNNEWYQDCPHCQHEATSIDWLLAVRKYGLGTANPMFEGK